MPAELLIELLLILLVILGLKKTINKKEFNIVYIIGVYLLSTIMIFFYRGLDNAYSVIDYVLIYKSIFYLFLLSLQTRNSFTINNLKYIFYVLLFFFVVKYSVGYFIYSIPRPGLFTENNFEIMLLLLLFLSLSYHHIALNKLAIISFIFVVFISGSRSAQACLVFIYFFLYHDISFNKKLIKYGIVSFLLFIFIVLFMNRLGGVSIDSIDRVKFLIIFIEELKYLNFQDVLFGTDIITPLSPASCSQLQFYSSLFSSKDSSVCFSVILHSYIFRAIFDHGIIGLTLLMFMFWRLLVIQGFDKRFSSIFIFTVLLNGLSVSSFNSVFFAFSFYLVNSSSKSLIKSSI
ncbi:hypothetical protein [Vibrio sp. EA2]|uniref:hypothetical protein n=1 Tax=Vibrio sp. EA2 TaxID=3079860 RepID=UPI00294A1F2F|nr:hypothetical protein [Vibrio sp. EA2]MDV6253344.1 hypothetical protein [Vibrio sp. EA2]